jgi:hypothetical protein
VNTSLYNVKAMTRLFKSGRNSTASSVTGNGAGSVVSSSSANSSSRRLFNLRFRSPSRKNRLTDIEGVEHTVLEDLQISHDSGNDTEILTPESKRSLEQQKELIRLKLFPAANHAEITEEDRIHDGAFAPKYLGRIDMTATAASQEVAPSGLVFDEDWTNMVQNSSATQLLHLDTSIIPIVEEDEEEFDLRMKSRMTQKGISSDQPSDEKAGKGDDISVASDPTAVEMDSGSDSDDSYAEDYNRPAIVSPDGTMDDALIQKQSLPSEILSDDRHNPSKVTESNAINDSTPLIENRMQRPESEENKNDDEMRPVALGTVLSYESSSIASKAVHFKKEATNKIEDYLQSGAARRLLSIFNCEQGTSLFQSRDMFYDNICPPNESTERPFYDEAFTLAFLYQMMADGVTVLHLQPPNSANNSSESDWNGRSVNMLIEPGSIANGMMTMPKLEWTTIPGGTIFEVQTTSMELLSVQSITRESPDSNNDDDQDVSFFTIMSDTGNVHIFEAATQADRDRIVNGLENVIARLSFHLIAGDPTGIDELCQSLLEEEKGDDGISSFRVLGPNKPMNLASHVLLD